MIKIKPTNYDYAQAMNQLREELHGHEPPASCIHERAQKLARKRLLKLVKA